MKIKKNDQVLIIKPGKSITMNVGRVHKNRLFLWSPNPEKPLFGNTMYFGNLVFE